MDSSPTADDHGGRSVLISLPSDAMVVLIGIAASGKSTFATRHFASTQILSSDGMRAVVADDPGAQGATDDAFDLLHRLLELRLRRGQMTVVDATNVEDWARAELLAIARRQRRPAVAIVLDVPLTVALERNVIRAPPRPPTAALQRQHRWLHDALHAIGTEGFEAVHRLRSPEEIDAVRIAVVPINGRRPSTRRRR